MSFKSMGKIILERMNVCYILWCVLVTTFAQWQTNWDYKAGLSQGKETQCHIFTLKSRKLFGSAQDQNL